MRVIRGTWAGNSAAFPSEYVQEGKTPDDADFGALRDGFMQMVREYDPESHVVLTVQHHSADLLSSYLLRAEPGPKEVHRTLRRRT